MGSVFCFNGFNRFTWFNVGKNNEERSLFESLATTSGDLRLDTFSSYYCKISRFTVGRWIIQV